MVKTPPPKRRHTAWHQHNILKAHRWALAGMNRGQIADKFGCQLKTLRQWELAHPLFKKAMADGKQHAHDVIDQRRVFVDYVYQQLPESLQVIWEELLAVDQDNQFSYHQARELLLSKGDKAHQSMFLHAMCCNGFNANQAMQLAGVTWDRYKKWRDKDPDFMELLVALEFYKHNMFESALINLVTVGDPQTVRYVAETQLADRGYGKKMQVAAEHTGQVNHLHAHLNLADLDLPPDVLRQVLTAVDKHESKTKVVEQSTDGLPDGVVP